MKSDIPYPIHVYVCIGWQRKPNMWHTKCWDYFRFLRSNNNKLDESSKYFVVVFSLAFSFLELSSPFISNLISHFRGYCLVEFASQLSKYTVCSMMLPRSVFKRVLFCTMFVLGAMSGWLLLLLILPRWNDI